MTSVRTAGQRRPSTAAWWTSVPARPRPRKPGWVSTAWKRATPEPLVNKPSPARIVPSRELDVVGLAADGRSNAEIALRLHLSTATVKTHLQHVYDKLEVSDRAVAVAQAIRRGLLP